MVLPDNMIIRLTLVLLAYQLSFGAEPADSAPENLAATAKITAESEYSKAYLAKFAADGEVPDEAGKDDPGRAWCVNGGTHRGGADLVFEWDEPVEIGEIFYYGRTAWFLTECWKDYEVYSEASDEPCAKGRLEMVHGPQRIVLPRAITTRKLVLRFTSSYGGPNPGASEVQVFSRALGSDAIRELKEAMRLQSDPYYRKDREMRDKPESQQLEKALYDGGLGFESLVVIQRHPIQPSHVYTYHNEGFSSGGGLCIFSPDGDGGKLRPLVECRDGQILDCDVSYDGSEILFSWRKSEGDYYQLYRIDTDGTGLRQLTHDDSYNFNGCWLPDGRIAFLSTRKAAFAYCWTSPVGILYRMDREGGNVERLSANYLNDFTPSVTNDGKIIYGRWEYVDRPAIPIQSLWTINPDGTKLAVYYGNRVLSPATFIEPRAMPGDGRVLCTMTAHNGPCRGAIGIIDPTPGVNAQAAIRNLTPEVDIGRVDKGSGNHVRGPYESPYPVDEEHFLVSRGGTILLRDYEGTRQIVLLRPKDGMGFYNAQPIRRRHRPPAVASTLPQDGDGWATVVLQDVYRGLQPHVKRGQIKQICVVQEIEKSRRADTQYRAFGFQFPVVSCGATYAPKKVWGYVPVEEDGSACFKVPAGLPLYFMAIDAQGRAVQRMRSFTHFADGEIQGCVGCHEPRSDSPGRGVPLVALAREMYAAERPEPPEWGLRGFSYPQIVQPILDEHCTECHAGPKSPKGVDLSSDKTDFFNVSYETLAREGRPGENPYTSWIPTFNGMEENILIVEPESWGSPVSKLAQIVLSGHPDEHGRPRVNMDPRAARRILAWIDLNVPYYGTSLSNHYTRTGCRRILPPDLDNVLQDVGRRRCASCHAGDGQDSVRIPRKEWVRIDNPELNNFLLAPLAEEHGGTQQCGELVFASPRDPDYERILATFEAVDRILEGSPRIDMVAAGCGANAAPGRPFAGAN